MSLVRKARWLLKWAFRLSVLGALVLALAWVVFPFPEDRLERWSVPSPTVLDIKGRPMLSIVGADEQWRRPVPLDRISPWLVRATIAVEDKRFYSHPGVDPVAVIRAAGQNLWTGRIVSGASTLTMQVCRMMDGRPRTFSAKLIESFRALQLTQLKSKRDVLALYLNAAPYGGNCRGVETAAQRYFDKHAADLSLGEAALLAGLPQSPSRLRPDRHLDRALERRQVVLRRMLDLEMITEAQRTQVEAEPTVIRGSRSTVRATHAAWLALQRRPRGGRTTINLDIQAMVERLAAAHAAELPAGSEQAVVVIDVSQSAIAALIGSGDPADPVDGHVNGALARRSPGSALKPFIYAAAFEARRLNGETPVWDVPIRRGGWEPSNFDRTFSGRVTAAEALRRSLNVPAILVAEGVGLERCCGVLTAVGVRLPANVARRGGLALAVGGIEVRLLDLTNAYATLARGGVRAEVRLLADEPVHTARALDANVCAAISDVLSCRRRRPHGLLARADTLPWFMWKTGTSAGRRDAWAVGHNGRYAVGVWVGRFRGTGRTAYVGAQAAEPLLARLLTLPALRRAGPDPAPPAPILVRRPLSPPAEVAGSLRITAPGNGEMFAAIGGKAVVQLQANQSGGLTWFLNARAIPADHAPRLELRPGRYELRCVDAAGRSSSVRFVVQGAAEVFGAGAALFESQ